MADQSSTTPWTVWRADDNGNRFVMRENLARDEAERVVDEFTARGHKQVYWIEPGRAAAAPPVAPGVAGVRVKHVDLAEALAMGPPPAGNLAVPVFAHGTLEAELYTPKGVDPQTPHERDEVYVVVRGRGTFFDGAARRAVAPGTFLFVAAGQPHRFEDFSDDLAVWVFFYGPRGGEAGTAG